jgi:hypothetical protein
MAIKTQLIGGQRRIITKVVNGQRRVSCSCCPSDDEGCCMYPADQLGVGYTLDDLPDQIEVREPAILGPDPVIFNKNGAEYEHFSQSSTEKVFVDIDGIGRPIWKFQSVSEEILERPLSFNAPFCLITEIEDVGFEGAGDLFADTYAATIGDFPFREPERASLCRWADGSFLLVYVTPESINDFDGEYTGPLYTWAAEGRFLQPDEGGGFWVKDDPQSSPVGTYQGISGQTGGFETFTISEP